VPNAADVSATAFRLRRLGLSVIPVPRPDGQHDGKVPAIAWREYQTRLPTEGELAQWFTAEPMNLAVITGAISDKVVIDADSHDALRLCVRRFPYTPWQTQTGRGWHLWYRHPGSRVANRARVETGDGRLAIDIRGDGGFVIVPPSVHGSGAIYSEAGDWTVPPEDLPRFCPEWLARPQQTRQAPARTIHPTGELVTRARAYLSAIPQPEIGQGSDTAVLYAACRLVRGFGLTSAEAVTLLWEWAGGRPGWDPEWIAQKVAHAERYGTEPIGALR
jgi:hypothetical protein